MLHKLARGLILFIGPLTVEDPRTGVHTVVGVAVDAPYTFDAFRQGPVYVFGRVNKVLPWIYERMSKSI